MLQHLGPEVGVEHLNMGLGGCEGSSSGFSGGALKFGASKKPLWLWGFGMGSEVVDLPILAACPRGGYVGQLACSRTRVSNSVSISDEFPQASFGRDFWSERLGAR